MRHVIGTFPEPEYGGGQALPRQGRVAFEDWETQPGGYFELIAPFFEDIAKRQCGVALQSINVLVVLSGSDLTEGIARTEAMIQKFSTLERTWQLHQGSEKLPGEPERQVYVTLYRSRLTAIVNWLKQIFANAHDAGHCIVFGNGVCYSMLCGIKLPPGTEVYS